MQVVLGKRGRRGDVTLGQVLMVCNTALGQCDKVTWGVMGSTIRQCECGSSSQEFSVCNAHHVTVTMGFGRSTRGCSTSQHVTRTDLVCGRIITCTPFSPFHANHFCHRLAPHTAPDPADAEQTHMPIRHVFCKCPSTPPPFSTAAITYIFPLTVRAMLCRAVRYVCLKERNMLLTQIGWEQASQRKSQQVSKLLDGYQVRVTKVGQGGVEPPPGGGGKRVFALVGARG